MRELTVQEMDQASGGIAPILGLLFAVAGMAVRHKATKTAIEIGGALLAGYSLNEWRRSGNSENSCGIGD